MNPFEAVFIWAIFIACMVALGFFAMVFGILILVGLLKSGGWDDAKLVVWYDETNDVMSACGERYFAWVNKIFNPFKWAKMLVDAKEKKEHRESTDSINVLLDKANGVVKTKKRKAKKLDPIDQMFEDMRRRTEEKL